ncbi:uncharacterized protein EMH_0009330 [Eimeria mitis]|uniref:ABC-2 type transporter transmembrane domain-containing protein n=1 Tax=Eimeria mitis TaxID=44415 RepID=U6K5A6_9EIME|nr:uncharacterized protein EMH_0009330 [Eimeria mitis]CDJ31527.1 hypothetical protein EMH_0009330 [Eimeria mitis]
MSQDGMESERCVESCLGLLPDRLDPGVLRMWVYFIGTSTSDTILFLVFPIIFHTITFWIMGLAATATKFFASLGVLLLSVLSLQSYGYFISAIVTDVSILDAFFAKKQDCTTCPEVRFRQGRVAKEVVALAVTQVAQVVLALFSGFMTQIDQLNPFLQVVAALSPFKYALSAFCLVIFENEFFIGEGGERVSGDDFLKGTFGIRRETCASDLGALAALIVVVAYFMHPRKEVLEVLGDTKWDGQQLTPSKTAAYSG